MPQIHVTFDGLAQLLKSAAGAYDSAMHFVVRSVAFQIESRWYHHTGSATVEPHGSFHEPPEAISIRDAALTITSVPIGVELTGQQVRACLLGWKRVTAKSDIDLQDPLYLNRHYSTPPEWPYPRWEGAANDFGRDSRNLNLPAGPYFAEEHDLFAEDSASLTALWLKRPSLRSLQMLGHNTTIDIRDPRARITGLQAEEHSLVVSVDVRVASPLSCAVRAVSHSGGEANLRTAVIGGVAELRFPFQVQSLEIWILTSSGELLDHYEESPRSASWGRERSLFSRPPQASVASRELAQLLGNGEDLHIEFKPYVRLAPKDTKARELLDTACAFANSEGGSILIGISDYGDIQGIGHDLKKTYGDRCKGDPDCLQRHYTTDVKRLLLDGLSPLFPIELVWHDVAMSHVLQIVVPQAPSPAYLTDNGDSFKRVGGTSRRVRPVDFLRPDAT